jgi:hypothetical protein
VRERIADREFLEVASLALQLRTGAEIVSHPDPPDRRRLRAYALSSRGGTPSH